MDQRPGTKAGAVGCTMKIILITDQISGQKWAYTSITAALNHIENPVDITPRRWSQIIKESGYPFQHSGCTIERMEAMTGRDVEDDNPAKLI